MSVKYCIWSNTCNKKNICCNYCPNLKCKDRCTDNCKKCKFLLEEAPENTNKFSFLTKEKKIKKEEPKISSVDLFETDKLLEGTLIERYQVRIGSGNKRGKTYYFDKKKDAIKKAKILEKRQKLGSRSIILQAELKGGKEIYLDKNKVEY